MASFILCCDFCDTPIRAVITRRLVDGVIHIDADEKQKLDEAFTFVNLCGSCLMKARAPKLYGPPRRRVW